MAIEDLVDTSLSSRDLRRALRRGESSTGEPTMPESVAWQVFLELRRRGEERADALFIDRLRSLHGRRSMAGSSLSVDDTAPDEHRLSDDDFLSELWRAYKKCLRLQRTGPAEALLAEIEDRLSVTDLAA